MNSFKKIIVIKNANQNAKEKIFTKISNILNENNISHHTIIRCGTANEVDCILIYELSLAITDEGLITTQIPLYSDVIDITDVCNCDLSVKKQISIINSKISCLKERMTSHLKEAKIIHDNWEKIYISNLDFNKINNECDELICNLLDNLACQS